MCYLTAAEQGAAEAFQGRSDGERADISESAVDDVSAGVSVCAELFEYSYEYEYGTWVPVHSRFACSRA